MARSQTHAPHRISYWLSSIKTWAPNSPVLLIGTHLDQCGKGEQETVFEILEKKFKPIHPNIRGLVGISNTTGTGIDKLKELIKEVAFENRQRVPRAYLELERIVEDLRDSIDPPVVWWNTFKGQCSSAFNDPELLKRATAFLHELGALVHIEQGGLSEIVVLGEYRFETRLTDDAQHLNGSPMSSQPSSVPNKPG